MNMIEFPLIVTEKAPDFKIVASLIHKRPSQCSRVCNLLLNFTASVRAIFIMLGINDHSWSPAPF